MAKRSKTMKKTKRVKTRGNRRNLKGGWKISLLRKSVKKAPVEQTISS